METIKKKCKIIRLLTKDNINCIYKQTHESGIGIHTELVTKPVIYNTYNEIEPQHLYITSDDEIKEGWVIDNDNELKYVSSSIINTKTGIARHLDDSPFILDGCKKIIATTDKSLLSSNNIPYPDDRGGLRSRKQLVGYLPQPPQSFIEEYVKAGGIDEVMVEYYDNAFNVIAGSIKYNDLGLKEDLRLKVNSNNKITIYPIKNTWTREEVIKFKKLADAIIIPAHDILPDTYRADLLNYLKYTKENF